MPTIVGILLIILFFYFIHFWQIYLDIFYPVVLECQDIFLFLGAFMFDFDDIIQYHARNLYELFYKRKGQTKDYPLVIRQKKGKPKRQTKRTPEE